MDFDFSPVQVLIVNDNRHMRSFLKSALHSFGVRQIVEADDAAVAFDNMNTRPIDLVIVDYDMLPMSGMEVARMIRHHDLPFIRHLPIVMVSSVAEVSVVMQARSVGINEYLIKPISADSLARRVRSALVNPKPFVTEGGDTQGARARRTSRKSFKAGQIIFREGDAGTEAYVVETGRIAIRKGNLVLGDRVKEQIFGEMALIDDKPRMASAIAAEDSTCLVIPKDALKAQVAQSSVLVSLVLDALLMDARNMGRRLVEVRAKARP